MNLTDILEARYAADRRFRCPECEGKGWVRVVIQYGEDDFDIDKDPCDVCDATGFVARQVRDKNLRESKYQTDHLNDVSVVYALYKNLSRELYQSNKTPVSDASAQTKDFRNPAYGMDREQMGKVTGCSLDVVMKRGIKVNQAFDYLKKVMKEKGYPYTKIRQHDLANKSKNDRYFEVQFNPAAELA